MDEPIKQLVIVAIAVLAGVILVGLVKTENATIMKPIIDGIKGFIDNISGLAGS